MKLTIVKFRYLTISMVHSVKRACYLNSGGFNVVISDPVSNIEHKFMYTNLLKLQ